MIWDPAPNLLRHRAPRLPHVRAHTSPFLEGTECATSASVQLVRLQKDLRTVSISWDIVNFPAELCSRRSGMFWEVVRLVPPDIQHGHTYSLGHTRARNPKVHMDAPLHRRKHRHAAHALMRAFARVSTDRVFRDLVFQDVGFQNSISKTPHPYQPWVWSPHTFSFWGSINCYFQTPHPQTPHPWTPEQTRVTHAHTYARDLFSTLPMMRLGGRKFDTIVILYVYVCISLSLYLSIYIYIYIYIYSVCIYIYIYTHTAYTHLSLSLYIHIYVVLSGLTFSALLQGTRVKYVSELLPQLCNRVIVHY